MATITIVLGAGLGKQYGFPDGNELRNLVIEDLSKTNKELTDLLRCSTAETIDEFIGERADHAAAIRKVVAKILHRCEDDERLFSSDPPNTYKLLLKQVRMAIRNGHAVKIVTFNYDRSLPYLIYKVNLGLLDQIIEQSILHHVFGRIAPLEFGDVDRARTKVFHDYGKLRTPPTKDYGRSMWRQAAEEELSKGSKISFIGEINELDSNVRSHISKSDQIFFLGVGYHRANMKILDIDSLSEGGGRVVVGTGLGLSSAQIESILETYPAINKIETCNAYDFLKYRFPIEHPEENRRKLLKL